MQMRSTSTFGRNLNEITSGILKTAEMNNKQGRTKFASPN